MEEIAVGRNGQVRIMVSKTDRDPAELLLHENLRLMAGLFQVEPTLRFTPVEIGFKRKEAATHL